MIINNTGLEARGFVGHPEIDSTTFEQGLPGPIDRRGWPKYVAGEMCQTLNQHWGYAQRDFDYISPAKVIENLALCRKVGTNYLLKVGPEAQGQIPEYQAAVLRRAGEWVSLLGDLIYEGRPTPYKASGRDFLLEMDGRLYWFA